jgi:hypothetical protein
LRHMTLGCRPSKVPALIQRNDIFELGDACHGKFPS